MIIDDRTQLTIGKRLLDAKKFGYPLIIVIGSKAIEDDAKFEIHQTNENQVYDLRFNEILELVKIYTNAFNYKAINKV